MASRFLTPLLLKGSALLSVMPMVAGGLRRGDEEAQPVAFRGTVTDARCRQVSGLCAQELRVPLRKEKGWS